MSDLALFDNLPTFPAGADAVVSQTVVHAPVVDWYSRYHYSGTCGTAGAVFYAVHSGRDGDVWLRVAIGPTSNASGLAQRYGLQAWPGNYEITRVARHPDAPSGDVDGDGSYFTSRGVAAVLRQAHIDHGWEWVFSYADTGQGHHGGMYQSLNAIYVGESPACAGWEILEKGEWRAIHPRSVVARFGTRATLSHNGKPTAIEVARARGESIRYVVDQNTAKHTYILPIGTKASRRAIRRHLEPFARPYPKRDEV